MSDDTQTYRSRCGLERYFLKKNCVMLYGDITEELSYSVIGELRYLAEKGVKEISVHVSSEGGDLDSCLAIIDIIQLLQEKDVIVKTVVEGKAYSCAAFIAIFGTIGHRFATKSSSIMLHESYGLGSDQDSISKNELAIAASKQQIDSLLESLAKYIGNKTKKQIDKFKEQVKGDLWLNVEQAIKLNVIDGEYEWK